MTSPIGAEKNAFENLTFVHDKHSQEICHRRGFLKLPKGTRAQPKWVSYGMAGEWVSALFPRAGTRLNPQHPHPTSDLNLNQFNKARERGNITEIGKEAVKLPLFSDGIITCVENPKESAKNLLELISVLNKVAGWKVNQHMKVNVIPTRTAVNTGNSFCLNFTVTPAK